MERLVALLHFKAHFSPHAAGLEEPALDLGVDGELRHGARIAVCVLGEHGEVARHDMSALVFSRFCSLRADADFHGRVAREIHVRLEVHEFEHLTDYLEQLRKTQIF